MDSPIEEFYLIWLTNRTGYLSKSHFFIIHKFNYKFNIYQSWLAKKLSMMNNQNYNLTNNLTLEDLNNSYLNCINTILTPNDTDEVILPSISSILPSKRKFAIPLKSGMRWSVKDEEIFNSIPGFDDGKITEPVEDWEKMNYIKPLFTYKKIDLTKNPSSPIENFNKFIDDAIDKINKSDISREGKLEEKIKLTNIKL